ncbi:MAG: tetratricopeptide repeat protein [Bacteroidales bacterium]|nr:tetratricopeptide repeat protein [Bacteroidales bacterium]
MKKTGLLLLLLVALALGGGLVSCEHNEKNTLPVDKRLELLDAKIKKDPKNARLYYERGKVLMELHRMGTAIVDLQKAIQLDNSQASYYTALGDAYFSNGDAGKSYETLQKALKLDPTDMEALLKMSEITFYSKDYDRAMETLNKVTEQDPNNKTAFFMKGFIYKETGDTANAVHYFRKLIDLYPDYMPAYEEMCVLYAEQHNEMAVEYLQTVLKLDSMNTNALYAVAMMYQDMEEADKANELYVKILERNPNDKHAWHNRGYLNLVLYEDYPAAIDFFTKAIDCDNQFVEAHVNRAFAYELKGDKANATIGYKTALQIDPNNEKAKDGLARLK